MGRHFILVYIIYVFPLFSFSIQYHFFISLISEASI